MPTPLPRADAAQVAARLDTLARAELCESCERAVIPVTADTVALLIEVILLRDRLAAARLESANRLAAIRAALHADAEGETEPLDYLRYELPGNDGYRSRP